MTGENLKKKLKDAGFIHEDAATLLEVSRQTLSAQMNRAEVSNGFLQKLKEKIPVLFEEKEPTNDFTSGVNEPEALYGIIQRNENKNLKELIKQKDEIIVLLKDKIADLEDKLKLFETKVLDVGKTGGRRTS